MFLFTFHKQSAPFNIDISYPLTCWHVNQNYQKRTNSKKITQNNCPEITFWGTIDSQCLLFHWMIWINFRLGKIVNIRDGHNCFKKCGHQPPPYVWSSWGELWIIDGESSSDVGGLLLLLVGTIPHAKLITGESSAPGKSDKSGKLKVWVLVYLASYCYYYWCWF